VFDKLPSTFNKSDFGSINRMVALEFPGDQLAYTGYSRDYNYSRFSYERFYTPNDKDAVLGRWKVDQDKLVAEGVGGVGPLHDGPRSGQVARWLASPASMDRPRCSSSRPGSTALISDPPTGRLGLLQVPQASA
jgi:hypothetical protein